MDTLEALRLFVSIAETGSLSAAARREAVATSTVSVALQQLEERVGAKLIVRSTRRLALTYEGQQFLSDARRLLADWDGAIALVQEGPLRGPIKSTAPLEFGREELAPIVDRFLAQHPEVMITLHLADDVIELVERQIDLALRFGPLTDSTLKARLLLRANRVVCAAPSYWKTRGVPERPEDLANHNCLVQARPDAPFATWTFLTDGQPKLTAHFRFQGIRFETVVEYGVANAPRGKIPFFSLDEVKLADSDLIIGYLKTVLPDPDAGLTMRQRALGHLVQRTLEDHLYWIALNYEFYDQPGSDWFFDHGWGGMEAGLQTVRDGAQILSQPAPSAAVSRNCRKVKSSFTQLSAAARQATSSSTPRKTQCQYPMSRPRKIPPLPFRGFALASSESETGRFMACCRCSICCRNTRSPPSTVSALR
jgi:DNA-binding transcriptional LysR family regulator